MKPFVYKTIRWSIYAFLLYVVSATFVMECLPRFSTKLFGLQDWMKIRSRVIVSKSNISKDTLFVGCSVAGQLLPFNHDNQLTTNGATQPIGNYFLIKNAIENNPNIRCVVYLSIPNAIGHKIASNRTFNYVVKPFYTFENRAEILASTPVRAVLTHNPWLDLCLLDAFKLLALDDFNYDDNQPKQLDELSPESIEWLLKIKELCEQKDVTFHLASPPISRSRKQATQDWLNIKNQVESTALAPLFDTYFSTIIYLEDKYLTDDVHWKKDFIEKERERLVATILERL